MQLPIVIGVIVLFLAFNSVKILKEYERGVVFFLGRLKGSVGPGFVWIWPIIETMTRLDTRIVTMDVPPQDVITKDNVSVKVNAVVLFRVFEPSKAIIEVENFLYTTSQLAQTTLRNVCGEAELDDLLVGREKFNERMQEILDKATDPMGVKVSSGYHIW